MDFPIFCSNLLLGLPIDSIFAPKEGVEVGAFVGIRVGAGTGVEVIVFFAGVCAITAFDPANVATILPQTAYLLTRTLKSARD